MKKVIILLIVYQFLQLTHIKAQTFTNYTVASTSTKLPSNEVNAIAIDAQGNIWFETSKGVSKFDGTNWTTYTTSNGLADNYVKAIAIDSQGNKWIGTGDGISKFDGVKWTTYTSKEGLVGNVVNTIAIDNQGDKWFGTYNGVSEFDGTTWKTYTREDGLADNSVATIAIDNQSNIWFGTYNHVQGAKVTKFDGSVWTRYTIADGILNGEYVGAIAIDKENNKWVGTYRGVSKYDGKNWTSYMDGLVNNNVTSIAIDAQGNKWFGTWGSGVSKLSAEGTTGIKPELNKNQLTIYPNPSTGLFNISFGPSSVQQATFKIFNLQGKLLHEETIRNANLGSFNISGLPKGIYIFSGIIDGKNMNTKISLQ